MATAEKKEKRKAPANEGIDSIDEGYLRLECFVNEEKKILDMGDDDLVTSWPDSKAWYRKTNRGWYDFNCIVHDMAKLDVEVIHEPKLLTIRNGLSQVYMRAGTKVKDANLKNNLFVPRQRNYRNNW